MTIEKFDTWNEAVQVLNDMPQNHDLNTLEAWALAYAIRCVERDKEARNGLSRTEQAIRETELYLSSEFEAFRDPADAAEYLDIESKR